MQHSVISRNNIKITGKGNQALLFIHGYGCDQNMSRFVTPAFKENYKVVLLDLVGCGNSDEAAYDYNKYSSLNGYVADIIEICDVLKLQNTILVGHSVSAIIAGLATIQRRDLFQKLIMICPSPRYINEEATGYVGGFTQSDIAEMLETSKDNYLGWSSAIAPVIMGNPDNPEFSKELANSFCRNNPEIAQHFATLTFTGDNRHDLEQIKLHTLVIQSSHDVIAPMEVGLYVYKHINGSSLKVLATTGHCPHLTAPEATVAAMADFLQV
jgi:sigma-B regulation protein RsbQ